MTPEKKILVVDDEITNVMMLQAMLKLDGLSSETFTDSNEAWQSLQATPEQYSLVLADRIMPGLNALQLLGNLKSTPHTQAIPLVVITGLAEREEQIDLVKAGAFDILLKPIDRAVLIGVVRRALQS